MPHILVPCTVPSLSYLPEIDSLRAGASWARGLKKIQDNILNLADPIRMLSTGSSLTSVYVGGTGIWWRSGVIGSISQMEQGEKEKAMRNTQHRYRNASRVRHHPSNSIPYRVWTD